MIGKKILRVLYFTENGKALSIKLKDALDNYIIETKEDEDTLQSWVKETFQMHLPLLFIGATGIAVRSIANFVDNKLIDSPVLVMDEGNNFVIPILSGHYGGANTLATTIEKKLGVTAVITTATDVNNLFAVDVFAKNNKLFISDKKLIKQVSGKILKCNTLSYSNKASGLNFIDANSQVTLAENNPDFVITDELEKENILQLKPKRLVIGIGCKKGKDFADLKEFVLGYYKEDYLRENLYGISSIDVKGEELGIIRLAQYFGVDYYTFSSEELNSLEGEFSKSEFVKEKVGVENVCERAAVALAGPSNSKLVLSKQAFNGMTLAAAHKGNFDIVWNS